MFYRARVPQATPLNRLIETLPRVAGLAPVSAASPARRRWRSPPCLRVVCVHSSFTSRRRPFPSTECGRGP